MVDFTQLLDFIEKVAQGEIPEEDLQAEADYLLAEAGRPRQE